MENSLARSAEPDKSNRSIMQPLVAHLDAAHNLARWLLRNEEEAEDAVQDAYLRALRHGARFRDGDGRAWMLTIVRNCCYDRLKRPGGQRDAVFNEQVHSTCAATLNPEASSVQKRQIEEVRRALHNLPPPLREVIVLRELEDMPYSQIARIVQIPLGTVMSRLSRARQQLRQLLLAAGNDAAR